MGLLGNALLSVNNDILTKSVGIARSEPRSAQYQAMDWLANTDGLQLIPSVPKPLSSDTVRVIIDRYVLAVFAYGFGGENSPLHTKLGWLTGNSTCSWRNTDGQLCNGDDDIVNIFLCM